MSERARRVDRVFTEALAAPSDEREALVRERCKDEPELVDRVLTLLKLAEAPEGAIERRFGDGRDRLWQNVISNDPEYREDLSGQQVGNWRLEQRIASGGLATVYRAERSGGVFSQQAAFKVLRRGLDTEDLIGRFRAEREILSTLNHPGIAKILDGGAMKDGRPYLVLEFVDGSPITEYCDTRKLGTRERVQLFIEVVRAIGHAHRRLIVHRDVKPSNILVNRRGRVSVLDFGIAKLLDDTARLEVSPVTRVGVSMYTPAYASPEQRSGDTVTTLSDVYQLGLVLVELLSRERPGQEAGRTADMPLQPSRAAKDASTRRALEGDLDAIVQKATHPDMERRYASTGEFADDLLRYLEGRPVEARPDRWTYRLGKLNRRKPWLLPLIGLLLAAVIAYVATLSVYSVRLAREQQLSAATEAFLLDLFKSSDPLTPADEGRGKEITVIEALDIGQKRVREQLTDQPEVRATLLASISEVYASLDDHRTAIALREEVLETESGLYGIRSPRYLESLRLIGSWHGAAGNREEAGDILLRQLELARDILDADSAQLGLSEIAMGMELRQAGQLEAGQALLLSGIDKTRPQKMKYPREMVGALLVSTEMMGAESPEDAYPAIEEAQAIADTAFGEKSLQSAIVRARLAATMTQFGNYEGSERNFLLAIPVIEQRLGPDHSITISTINNLGYLYNRPGSHFKAEMLYRQQLEQLLAIHGRVHRSVADCYQNLAVSITKQERFDESLPLHREAYEIYRELYDDEHFMIAFPLLSMAFGELQRGRPEAAEIYAEEARERFRSTLPGTFFEGVAQCLCGLALEGQGRVEEGRALVTGSHALLEKGNVPVPYPELCRMPAG